MSPAHPESGLRALRLYFPAAARVHPTRFWHRLGAPMLAHHLLHAARRAGIAQAVLHRVESGYLAGQARLFHHHPELHDMRHPQCLELLDSEPRLRGFLGEHAEELRKVKMVLFQCEAPLPE